MQQAYLYDAIRTPFGKIGGALSSHRPDDLAAHEQRPVAVGGDRDGAIAHDLASARLTKPSCRAAILLA